MSLDQAERVWPVLGATVLGATVLGATVLGATVLGATAAGSNRPPAASGTLAFIVAIAKAG